MTRLLQKELNKQPVNNATHNVADIFVEDLKQRCFDVHKRRLQENDRVLPSTV